MTYTWPAESTIWKHQCAGTTAAGERCRARKWTTPYEHPNGWYCWLHRRQECKP